MLSVIFRLTVCSVFLSFLLLRTLSCFSFPFDNFFIILLLLFLSILLSFISHPWLLFFALFFPSLGSPSSSTTFLFFLPPIPFSWLRLIALFFLYIGSCRRRPFSLLTFTALLANFFISLGSLLLLFSFFFFSRLSSTAFHLLPFRHPP